MKELMIEAHGLTKRYGSTHALRGVDLEAPPGSVLGLLGPNGAGKTTAVRILTTLARPDRGSARVAGHDVTRDAAAVRRRIGVVAQDATLDEALTGRQNLQLVGWLSHLGRAETDRRAAELLERLELADAADRVVKGYSGGMRRRLDLAAGMLTRPAVLFLDEPTTGLDPTSRGRVWEVIRELVREGVTLLLTTQYLDEADQLADRIAVVDHGRVIAEGTAAELKGRAGQARLEVILTRPHPESLLALAPLAEGEIVVSQDGLRLRAPVAARPGLATTVVRTLDRAGIEVDDVQVLKPSLDDVFFALTGAPAEPEAADTDERLLEVAR